LYLNKEIAMFSERTQQISPSLTLAISAKAKALKAEGIDVIGFGAGEPDFDTPNNIKEAAKKAIDQGFTKYTPASGTKELKEAVVHKMKEDNGLEYEQKQVIIGCGAKHVIAQAIFSLVDKGQEVIIPAPYWLSYPQMVKLAGGLPRVIQTGAESGFKITPGELEKSITPQTRIIILNSPSNPTGAVYTKEELWELAGIIERNNILCISDEIYEKLIYDNLDFKSIACFSEKVKAKTIVINGVSKAYSMTGWRIGYACAEEEIISSMSKVQSHTTSGPCSISQKAAVEALTGSQEPVLKMRQEFQKRRDIMVEKINKIRGLKVNKPKGAFYCFVDISEYLNKKINQVSIKDSLSFANLLLDEEKVALVPGKAFGNDNYVRLSYAVSVENIETGLNRLENFVNKTQ
jgi:aspartate aminotransferase